MTLELPSLDFSFLLRIGIAIIVGALLCLDKIAIQIMLSRPLVSSTIVGLILGTPLTGLTAGALLEIFWVNKSPLGTYMPPNDTLVAILITITLAVLSAPQPHIPREFLVIAFLFYLPLGYVFQKMEVLPAWFNNRMSEKTLIQTDTSSDSMYRISLMPSLFFYFCFSLSLIFVGLLVGLIFIPILIKNTPSFVDLSLVYVYYALPLIGVAAILTTTQHRKTLIYFTLLYICCSMIMEIFLAK